MRIIDVQYKDIVVHFSGTVLIILYTTWERGLDYDPNLT